MMANATRVQARDESKRNSNDGPIQLPHYYKNVLDQPRSSSLGVPNQQRESLTSLNPGSQTSSTSPIKKWNQNYKDHVPTNLRDKFIHLMKLRQCEIACSDQQVLAKVERLTKVAMARIKEMPQSGINRSTQEDVSETSSCDREELGDGVADLNVTQVSKDTSDSQGVKKRRNTRVRGAALFINQNENASKSLKPLKGSPTDGDVKFKLKKGRHAKRPRKQHSNLSDPAAENQPYRRQSMMRFDVVE